MEICQILTRHIRSGLYECPLRHLLVNLTNSHIYITTMAMEPPPRPTRPMMEPPSEEVVELDDSDSDPESDTDTATPSAQSPSTPRRLPQISDDEEPSERFLDQLRTTIEGYPSFANYCCGGSIPISTASRASPSFQDSSKAPVTSPPVNLRFDTPTGSVHKITLPPGPEEERGKGKSRVEVEELVAFCTPDLIGDEKVGRGQRVRSRRSCARLSKDKFSIDVHPADLGILDTIKQVLLPDLKLKSTHEKSNEKGRSLWDGVSTESWREREEHWGIRAELCDLTIYFSSSSNTQKPFDTSPRQGTHWGTLVICLPSAHQGGGQLIHHPNPQFNPSLSPPQTRPHTTLLPTASLNHTISWSAFPRGTSHSILPITCGHLVTLTYNLYTSEAIGGILQRYPIADPRLYPFFRSLRSLLSEDDFLRDGGTLGHYCMHNYHHTRRQAQHHMPYSLLGTDAIFFSVFRALGLKAMVGPVLGDEAWDEWAQRREEKLVRKMYREGQRQESDEEMGEGSEGGEESDEEEDVEVDEANGETARVGKGWWRLKMVSGDGDYSVFKVGGEPTGFINNHYPIHPLPEVTWLNESSDKGWEIAVVNLKSTSQATPKSTPSKKGKGKPRPSETEQEDKFELMWQYSHAAIFVEIPPFGVGVRGSPRQQHA